MEAVNGTDDDNIALDTDSGEQMVADADAPLNVDIKGFGNATDEGNEVRCGIVREGGLVEGVETHFESIGLENFETIFSTEARHDIDETWLTHAAAQDRRDGDSALRVKTMRVRTEKRTDFHRSFSFLVRL